MVGRSPKVQQTRPSTRIKLNRQFLFSIFLYSEPGQNCFGIEHFEGKIPRAGIGYLGVRDLTSKLLCSRGLYPGNALLRGDLNPPEELLCSRGPCIQNSSAPRNLTPEWLCSKGFYPRIALLWRTRPSECSTPGEFYPDFLGKQRLEGGENIERFGFCPSSSPRLA